MGPQPKKHNHVRQKWIYLLTCWREQDKEAQTINWRFKLETPGPKQKRIFESLEDVLAEIEKELI